MANTPTPFPIRQGTGLVDRINVSIHLRRYLKLIGRRWLLLVLSMGILTGIFWYRARQEPDVFSSFSTIGFNVKVESGNESRVGVMEPGTDKYFENQLQIMQSSAVRGKVAEKMRNYKSPTGIPVWSDTRADQGRGSTFLLSVDSHEFEYARQYVSNWARAFVAYKNEIKDQAIEKKTAATRLDRLRYEQELEKIRNQVLDFKKQHMIGSVKDAGVAAQQQLDKLTAEYTDLVTTRTRLENYTREQLADGLATETPRKETEKTAPAPADPSKFKTTDPLAPFRDTGYGDLKIQLKSKQAEYALASKTLKPKHPHMINLTNQLAKITQDMQFQLENIEDRRKAQIDQLKKDEASLLPVIADKRNEVFEKSRILHDFEKLQEDEDSIKKQLDATRIALANLEAAPTSEETFNIMDEGAGSSAAVGPNRRRMILNGLMYGAALGLGLIFLLHRLDDRMELAEDVEEELEEPVLGQIPQLDKASLPAGNVLVTKLDQHNMFAESIRGVRSAVLFGSQGASRKVMLVSSAVPGDGKTTFTVNFAATLASAGQKVLLVDADLRRGNTHNYFEQPREPGLTEVLLGELHWEDVINETSVKTLQVINSGKLPTNPGELLISPVMREFIEEARKNYDHILFDCPPLTAIDDTFCLLGMSDGLLFVVKAGQTSMKFAKNALSAVRQRGAEIIGVVLNGITGDNPYYYYNHYYHAYYNSGEKPTVSAADSKPAVKMATRRRTHRVPSIEAAAQARAGQPLSSAEIVEEERRKAEDFKARRAAQRKTPGKGSHAAAQPAKPDDSAGT